MTNRAAKQDAEGRKVFINERARLRTYSKPQVLCRLEVSSWLG